MALNEFNNLDFVKAFYKLFSQHENQYFVVSKEQALLYMQSEFDRHISFTYIKKKRKTALL